MKNLRRRIKVCLCRISRRYKFRQICKAIDIAPYKWQRQYVLRGKRFDKLTRDSRCTGKTTAVILRLLMIDLPVDPHWCLMRFFDDPDFSPGNPFQLDFYRHEYSNCFQCCLSKGIPIVVINWVSILNEYQKLRRMP